MPTPPNKAFRITRGRGFQIRYPNGYTVSVQFGVANYCERRSDELGEPVRTSDMCLMEGDLNAGKDGSDDAETAIIDPDGNFVPYSKEDPAGFVSGGHEADVQGYMTAQDVLTMMVRVAALPTRHQTEK